MIVYFLVMSSNRCILFIPGSNIVVVPPSKISGEKRFHSSKTTSAVRTFISACSK